MEMDSKIVCGNVGFCPPPPQPNPWIPHFPKPKPPYVPPVPPAPNSPTYSILHLSDIHFDPLYMVGTNAKCGEPMCCRKVSLLT